MNIPSRNHPALNGEVTFDGDYARLFYQRRLPHSPATVWAAITEPEQLRHWFMASVVAIQGGVGGTVETVAGISQIKSQGRILAWDPPRVFEYEWNVEPRTEMPAGEESTIRWELQEVEGKTLLTLIHRRLTRPTALGFAPGWHAFLDRLSAQLAGEPLPDWRQRFGEVRSAYPAWQ